MHPEADAFLDAIFDHPDDDTPRLVYADWLEEHDEGALAEFIRTGCAIAHVPPRQPRPVQLRERERAAWESVRARWPEFFRITGARKDWFHRGFLNRPLVFVENSFFSLYPDWIQWFPVGRLALRGFWRDLDQITARPELLARVHTLVIESVEEDLPATFLLHLVRHPRFGHLRDLRVSTVRASHNTLIELADAPWLPTLHSLSLSVRVETRGAGRHFEFCGWCGPAHRFYRAGQPTIREQILAYAEASASKFLE